MPENVVRQNDMKAVGRNFKGSLGELTEAEFALLSKIINHKDSEPLPYPDNTKEPPYAGLFSRGYVIGKDKGRIFKKTVIVPTEKGMEVYRTGYTKRMEQEDVKL